MRSKIKVSKIGGVIFLSVLIWVWSDLALEGELPLKSRPLRLEASDDPSLAMAFETEAGDHDFIAVINQVTLKGPGAVIQEVDRMPREKLEFVITPEMLGVDQPGIYTPPLLDLLRRAITRDKHLAGLTVQSCEPDSVSVRVVRLTRMVIPVQCVDVQGIPMEEAIPEPPEVEMFIPEQWGRERRVAHVTLAATELERAQMTSSDLMKKPFVMVLGRRREAEAEIRISMPDIEDQLQLRVIKNPKLGFVMSETLQNKYSVELDQRSLDNALSAIQIRASAEAHLTYEKSFYHVLLDVLDSDAEVDEIAPRRLRYNLPLESMRSGQIRLEQDPVSVTFKLVPKSANGTESGNTD